MIYLASPYYHKDPNVMEKRYEQVRDFTAAHLKMGCVVFSPIVHCHHLVRTHDLPKDHEFWLRYDLSILRLCEALWVLKLPDWEQSVGVAAEINFARNIYVPIEYFEWLG